MNPDETIQAWREGPSLAPASERGWTVTFAMDAAGNIPALDYLDGTASSADPDFPVTQRHMDRLAGLIQVIRDEGPPGLRGNSSFVEFIGDDAKSGMCEFRVIPKQGHRFLCFQRGQRELVIAHAFRKPGRRETPQAAKTSASNVLREHVERTRIPPTQQSSHPRRNRRSKR